MGQTLRSYAIRQVALPTLMALLTITFVFMIRSIYPLINFMLLPSVSVWQVARLLGLLLPSVIVFTAPMAMLIGALIGVGRMAMDREILAIRASGINLISVFIPTLAGALILSLAIFWLSSNFVPATLYGVQLRKNQFKLAFANALQPGRFYGGKDLFESDQILYFKEREAGTGRMLGIVLEMEKSGNASASAPATASAAGQDRATSPTSAAKSKPKLTQSDKALKEAAALAGSPAGQTELTLIFARSGKIDAEEHAENVDLPPDSSIVLTLENGSVHRLAPDPEQREYVFWHFDTLVRRDYSEGKIDKRQQTLSSSMLRRQIAGLQSASAKRQEKDMGVLAKELWQRRALWLAAFVFTLTGIPLAIWVRPSGKSWGILIAIGLLLVYYVILHTGLAMIANGRSGGALLAMFPNALYALIGALLWRHTLRS